MTSTHMDWPAEVARSLKLNGIDMVAYVPDEVTGDLLKLLESIGEPWF